MSSNVIIPPKIIYKYVNYEIGMKIITNNQLMFTKPNNFNDPYDSYPGLIDFSKPSVSDIRRILSKSNKLKKIEKKNLENNPKDFIEALKYSLDKRKSKIGVSCFSKLYNQMIMWSHYGDNHKGFCIGFNFNPIAKNYITHEVRYKHHFEKVSFYNNFDGCIDNWLLTKSFDWSYEEEVRAISFDSNGLFSFHKEVIKEIYFGCRFKNKQLVISQLNELDYNIELFDLKLMKKEFRLERKPAGKTLG